MTAGVLVVEDDAVIGASLVAIVAAEGYRVQWAALLSDAVRQVSLDSWDLVLLDLALPDGDGLELCRQIRLAQPDTVVVVVTARSEEADAVRALDSGADDVITKPFRPEELRARLRAHLRRREVTVTDELRCGLLHMDERARRAWLGDAELSLRPKELELLAVLVRAAGHAVRREQLIDEVWDEHWQGSTKTLDVHIGNLRRKLADAGDRWDRIATLRGFGYRYELD
ncbi:MAG: phosphate regulon transcriptional regulatory protein PhoB [Frankiales bacterium]|nr:phosphate regulon transcriptional regulatory protein PhoB [Frankiales bacterium]